MGRDQSGTPQDDRFDEMPRADSDTTLEPDSSSWPAVTYEEHEWVSRNELLRTSRRVLAASRGPYRAAVVPRIATITDFELANDVAVDAGDAAVEIARFDAELGPEIAPFAAILLRSESVASSRIEQLSASAKAIALAELGDKDRRNASLIVSNTQAMNAAVRLADRLNGDAILEMHAVLLGAEHPEWAGKWRDEQVWIGGSNNSPHGAAFVPPHRDRVPAAMADLVAFMARDDLAPDVPHFSKPITAPTQERSFDA